MEFTGQNQGRQEETHHPSHRFRRIFLDLLLMGWRGCASAMGVIKKQDFSNFCFIPCFINSCMEEVQVGVIYKTLLDSNEGDISPHASQTKYFSVINENKISDRETPVELLSLEPQYGTEPLLISSISIIRHSEAILQLFATVEFIILYQSKFECIHMCRTGCPTCYFK